MKILEFDQFADLIDSKDLKSDGLIRTLIVLVSVHGLPRVEEIFGQMKERIG